MPAPGATVAFLGTIAANGTTTTGRGGVLARTSAGVYTCTLDQACAAADCCVIVTPRAAAASSNAQVVHTSDTVKTITTQVTAGAAADTAIDVVVFRFADLTG